MLLEYVWSFLNTLSKLLFRESSNKKAIYISSPPKNFYIVYTLESNLAHQV